MLTARDAVPDRIAGLDNGADDYWSNRSTLTNSWRAFVPCASGAAAG
jgi:hypothetical protein